MNSHGLGMYLINVSEIFHLALKCYFRSHEMFLAHTVHEILKELHLICCVAILLL